LFHIALRCSPFDLAALSIEKRCIEKCPSSSQKLRIKLNSQFFVSGFAFFNHKLFGANQINVLKKLAFEWRVSIFEKNNERGLKGNRVKLSG
jgi:hypothetical protein